MTNISKVHNIIKILKAIGCKISFDNDELKFSDKNLISEYMLNMIYQYEDEIKTYLQNDISIMSLSIDRGGVGTHMKKILDNISNDYIKFTRYEEMDARGLDWCDKNKNEILAWLRNFSIKNNITFSKDAARTLIRKAISNAKKSLLIS